MRRIFLAFVALAMTAPAYTQTTPPSAPSVTAGAEFKGLRFDWDPVQGAGSYQLEYRAHEHSGWAAQLALPASATHVRFRLPLHLFDWTYARYRIAACNSAGCTRSNEVSVDTLRRDVVGYFKASATNTFQNLGADTDISPDGLNFVAAATSDDLGGTTERGPAAYVFRRNSSGQWTERARLVPPVAPIVWFTNTVRVGMSADGNTVVMGLPDYQHGENDTRSGEVFVFHFNGTSWIRTRLMSGNRRDFGRWVAINDAGDTIATPYSEGTPAVAIYKLIGGAWQPIRGLRYRAGESCYDEGVLSSDGAVLAESCDWQPPGGALPVSHVRVFSGPNWTVREDIPLTLPESTSVQHFSLAIDGTGNTIVAQVNEWPPNPFYFDLPSEVQVFSRSGGAYSKVAAFRPGAWRNREERMLFGNDVAISSDGGTIAIGDATDNGFGTGPRAAPLNPGAGPALGAVYIYRLKATWVLANMVKPNNRPPPSEYIPRQEHFGSELSLNGNGQTLIVGNPQESRSSTGIGGDWSQGERQESGAIFLY
jgi:hypothetical protein